MYCSDIIENISAAWVWNRTPVLVENAECALTTPTSMSTRFTRTNGVVTTRLLGRVGDPSLSTRREIAIHRNLHHAGMVSPMQQHHRHCYFQRMLFSPSIEQDYDPEWVSTWKCDRDAPKDTPEWRQRLVEQTYIVMPIWDKGFICVNHILLLPINSISALIGNNFIISPDNANTGAPFPGTSPSWSWLHSPCQMSKFKCLLQSWLPACR